MISDWKICLSAKLPGRVVIPVIQNNEVCNYVARAFVPSEKRYTTAPGGTGAPLKALLYNSPDKRDFDRRALVVCEGVFDAISVQTLHPYVRAVATFGVNASAVQIEKLHELKMHYERTFVWYDLGAEHLGMELAWKLGADFLDCLDGFDDPEGYRHPTLQLFGEV